MGWMAIVSQISSSEVFGGASMTTSSWTCITILYPLASSRSMASAPQRLHGVHEDVSGGGLDDVLHELGAVAFQTEPLLLTSHTLVCDGLAAEAVFADLGFHIDQLSARGERDEHHAALVNEADAVCLREYPLFDALLHRAVNIPPKFDNVWV